MLDNENAGTAGALVDRPTAAAALAESQRKGYLDGKALAGVFAWLRPNDLVWNYWVNNYLLGKDPPAFDVLYWNADSTNLPAALHRDFMELSLANDLVRPGERVVLDTPIDLSQITVDSYQVAGIADHITPWQSNYRSTHLLGSQPRFVLSTSGHIASLVNPPGNEKASYQVNDSNPPEAEAWLRERHHAQGHVVGRLRRLAGRALRRGEAGPQAARRQGLQAAGSRAGHLRAGLTVAHADGLYYERHGAGDPLLLITGWTISAAVFEPVLDLYAQHFECIVYDHRGSARSEGSSPATMGALADDAARLLTALRIPRALVYGLSMGGMVAQEVALRHPGRVRGLILGGTTPGGAFAPRLGPKEVVLDRARRHRRARHPRAAAVLLRVPPRASRARRASWSATSSATAARPRRSPPRRWPARASPARCGSTASARRRS